MERKIKSVKFNFIMNSILTVSSFIFPLITFPYASRVLQVETYGNVSFAQSVLSYFVLVSALGIPNYGIRACAKVRDNKKELSKTTKELLIITICSTILTYFLFFVSIITVDKFSQNRDLLLINSLSIILNTIGVQWLFSALEQYSYITIRNIAFKIVMIVLMFVFVHNPTDYLIYALIAVVGSSASNILNFFYMFKFVDFKDVGKLNLVRHIRPTLVFFASTAAISIYTSLDSVMLGFLTNDVEVGLYTASIRLKSCLVGLVNSLGTVLLPRMSYYISKGMKKEYAGLLSKSFNFIVVISVPITVFFVLFARECLLFLSGEGYLDATLSMQLIIPSLIFIGLSTTISNQVLIPHLKESKVCLAVWSSAIVDFFLNLFFIPIMGAAGAALATLIAEVVSLFVQACFARTIVLSAIKEIEVVKIVLATIVSIASVVYVQSFFNISLFFQLCVYATVFFGCYFVILVIIKEQFVYEQFMIYLNKIRVKMMRS